MEKLQSLADLDDYIKKNVICVFTSQRCYDCKNIELIINQVEQEFPDFEFLKIEYDEFLILVDHLFISGVPSLVAFSGSIEIGRLVNKYPKTLTQIRKFVLSLKVNDKGGAHG